MKTSSYFQPFFASFRTGSLMVIAMFFVLTLYAQEDSTQTQTGRQDTTKTSLKGRKGDRIKIDDTVRTNAGILIAPSDSTEIVLFDSSQTEKKKRKKHPKKGTPEWDAWAKSLDPNKAYKKSLILPGLGQAYNHSYWKIPIIYAGFGAIGYFFVDNHKYYKEYQTAYRCRLDPNCTDAEEYENISNSTLVSERDRGRRNRDLMVVVGILWYGINSVDAYVEAHLKYFDVSDDLSLQIHPTMVPVNDQRRMIPGASINLQLK